MSRNRKQKHSLTFQVQEKLKSKLAIGHSKQEDKKQELDSLFLYFIKIRIIEEK